ncbi:MAG: Ig-like domain-containing protein [Hylemonella sp.]|nr:Ig-like domain-containing protein [Hylemonella sp.]
MSRYRTVLGLDRAPSGLGLLFLLSMVHELARADSTELTAPQLAELSGRLAVQRDELLAMVDVIRSSYPEISDQLYGEQASEVTGGRGDEVDLLALAEEITALEESGYLDHEEILRLRNALKALQEEAWQGDDVIVAQAGSSETPAGESRAGAGEGSAAGAEEGAVDIEALPATGAGPLAIVPALVAGGAAVAVAAASTTTGVGGGTTPDTTPPAAPTFALTVDTGASTTDGITSDGRVTVSGLESGATWQYSTNSGTSWTTGSGNSFTLATNSTFAIGAVQVRQTDAARNTSTATSNGTAITVDSSAPVANSLTQNGATQLVINYDSTLDASNPPPASAFAVTANGGSVTVSTVSVSGSTVTLNLGSSLTTGQTISVTYTDPTTGNDAGATQDVAGNDAVTVTTGKVADGYVRDAQIYIDANGNGQAEDSEMLNGVKTDANGNFFLPDAAPSGAILAVGGVNIDTGVPNTGILKAPAGSTMISPLTTLMQAYIEANPSASADSANTAVLSALNLPTGSGIDLTTYDPLAILSADGSSAVALQIQQAAAKVATLVELAANSSSATGSAEVVGSTVINNLVSQITTAANNGTTISLTDATVLSNALNGAVSNVSAVQSAATTANTNIANATSISGVSSAQAVALDTTPPAKPTVSLDPDFDSGSFSTDGITKNSTVDVRVSFNTTATDGTAAVAGNKVTLLIEGVQQSQVTLTATHISQGYVDISVSGLTGTKAFTSQIADLADNESTLSSGFNVTVDQSAPSAPTLALAADTGVGGNNTDLITSNGTVNVSGLESGASWQYSTDSGHNWSTGSGSSFMLTGDGSKSVLVRQTDVAGNTSVNSSALSFTLDATAPGAPVIGDVAGNNNVDVAESLADITISGTAQANAALTVIWGNVRLTTTADGTGAWSLIVPQAQIPADGDTTVVALTQDAAGNLSAAGTRAVSITSGRQDTTAPDAPVINTVAGNNVVNAAERDAGVTLSGTAESGSVVRVTWGGTTKTTTAGVDGSWSSAFASAEIPGAGNISVTATDTSANANVSAAATRTVTIDTAAPAAPVISVVASNNMVNASEKSAGVAVAGTAEANATVAVTWGSTGQTVTADGSGNWTTTFASSAIPASGNITAVATDAAGNTSSAATRTVTIDTSAPTAPTIATVSGDNRVSSSEKTAGVTVTGTAEAGATVSVVWAGGATKEVTANASGAWSATFASTDISGDGSRVITATATDAAGNASAAATRTVTVDTTAPTLLTINDVTGSDNRVSVAEGSAGVTVTGTAELGSSVTLTWGSVTKTITVGAAGNWSSTFASSELPPANGSNTTLSATVRDLAGNVSATATTKTVYMETLGNNVSGVLADNLVTAADGRDSVTLAADQTFNLTQTEYLGTAFQAALAKVTNAVSAYVINVREVTSVEVLNIGAKADVDSISLAAGQTINLTATQYNSNTTALGKIQNVETGYTLAVTGVSATNVLSIGGDAKVDTVTLADNQTLSLTYTQYNSNAAALGKIQNVETGYTLNVTGVAAANFLTVAGDGRIDGIALTSGATLNLTAAQYTAHEAKIGNAASDFTLNVSGVAAADFLTVAGNAKVDGITLASGESLTLTYAQYTVHAAKIGNAAGDYTLTVQLASASEADDIAALVSQGNPGGRIDVLGVVDGAITLTDVQAEALANAGFRFDSADSVTATASGARLQTSLSNLQKLGVDTLLISGSAAGFAIPAGADTVNFAALPTVTAPDAMRVGLEVPDGYFGTLTAPQPINASELKAAGFDAIFAADGSLTLDATQTGEIRDADLGYRLSDDITMSIRPAAEVAAIESIVGRIDAGQFTNGAIDFLDVFDNGISITAAQATSLVDAGIEFAANDTITVNAEGTPLQSSLSNLQKLGVDIVNVGAGLVGGVGYGIAGGEGLDYGALPTINADAGVRVGLEVPDGYFGTPTAPQPINASELKAAGFDAIFAADGSLTLDATQTGEIRDADLGYRLSDDITMSIRPAGEASAIASIVGRIDAGQFTNGAIDFLDVFDNGISITAAQATSLVDAGIEFAANDTVTVNAEGTQLQTSLSNLQKLGVDIVNVGAGLVGGVGYGIAGGEGLDYGALPTINANEGVRVGLLVADGTLGGLTDPEIAQFGANADALAAAGFVALVAADGSLTIDAAQAREVREAGLGYRLSDEVTMSIRSGGETTVIETLTTQINNNQFTTGAIDILDVLDNGISISDDQASALVGAGLQFAAGDTGVAIQATGTQLSTSLTDLQRLGVDFVHTGSGAHTVVLDWGTTGGVSNTLPVFDSVDQVKVSVRDSDLDDVVSFLNAVGHNTPNIDVLSVALRDAFGAELAGAGVGDPLFQINNMGIELNASVDQMVTLGMILEAADGSNDSLAALYGLSGQTLATGLTAAGISNIHVDAMTHFEVTDGDLNALLNAGLVSANAAADVTVTNTDGTLDVTLAQLANIGADLVQTSGATLQVHAGVSFSNGAELTLALNELVVAFEAQGGGTVQQLFEAADTVDLRVAGSLPSFELGAELTTKLQLLGIDDIKDANGHSIKPIIP